MESGKIAVPADAKSRLAQLDAEMKTNIDLIQAASGAGNGLEQLELDRRAGLVK